MLATVPAMPGGQVAGHVDQPPVVSGPANLPALRPGYSDRPGRAEPGTRPVMMYPLPKPISRTWTSSTSCSR